MSIVNWEYYNSLYNKVDASNFEKFEELAEKQVKAVIGTPKWNSIDPTAFYYSQLKDCICGVIDQLVDYDRSGAGRGIASVSNDGYTESYTVQTLEQALTSLRGNIIMWLSGTGLVGAYKC